MLYAERPARCSSAWNQINRYLPGKKSDHICNCQLHDALHAGPACTRDMGSHDHVRAVREGIVVVPFVLQYIQPRAT
jgi:hypothetical protein